jgi:iron(III) transport system permease protein
MCRRACRRPGQRHAGVNAAGASVDSWLTGSARRAVQWTLLALLGVLVVLPMVVLFVASVTPQGTLPLRTARLTLQNFVQLAALPGTWRVVLNTVQYAIGSVVVAGTLAFGIAWLTERTDTPGRGVVRALMFSWMAIPPLVFAYGWVLLLNPNNGALNNLLKWLFDLTEAPLTPYSMTALVAVSGMGLTPTAYVMISGILRNMDPVLEQAALVLGSSRPRVFASITLPLLRPGILSITMYLVMTMIQSFDFPLIIGLSARIPVLSTRIYTLASTEGTVVPNYGLAATFGVLLFAIAMVLVWIYFRATRVSERYRVVSGKGFRPRRTRLRGWRYAASAAMWTYLLAMLLPVLNLFWTSLLPYYQTPSWSALTQASFKAYVRIANDGFVRSAIGNTAILMIASATVVMAISFFVAWYSVRARNRIGRLTDALAFAPIAIPPIVMAMAILILYLRTPIYGSVWILVLGHVSVYIAFGSRSMISAMTQLHRELEDAAVISGASWLASLRRIVGPLLSLQILNGWLWVLAHSARDLTFPLLMLSTSNLVAASAIWTMWDYPDPTGASALALMLVAAMMLFVIPAQVYVARRTKD